MVFLAGITRFEDRGRLPLGSNFNVTSFSARILSQAAYNPKARVFSALHFCAKKPQHHVETYHEQGCGTVTLLWKRDGAPAGIFGAGTGARLGPLTSCIGAWGCHLNRRWSRTASLGGRPRCWSRTAAAWRARARACRS